MGDLARILVGIVFIAFFYGIFYFAFRLAFGKDFIKKNFSRNEIYIVACVVLFILVFCTIIVSQNQFVYFWDYGNYWTMSYSHMHNLDASLRSGLNNLWDSIITADYNLILPTIIYLPLKLFGFTFSRYVFVNTIMFVIPSFLLFLCLCKKILSSGSSQLKDKKIFFMSLILSLSIILIFLVPHLLGYIDTALLIPITLLVALVLEYNPAARTKKQFLIDITMSVLACITFLFRRYAGFFVVGFFVALFVLSLVKVFQPKNRATRIKNLKNAALNFLITGLTAAAIMLIFFHDLVFRVLGNNYADKYSGYSSSLAQKLDSLFGYFGIYLAVLAILGIVNAVKNKRHLKLMSFSVISLLVTVGLFFRVQNMYVQHILIIVPQVLALITLGFDFLINLKFKNIFLKKVIMILAVLLLAFEPVNCFAGKSFFKNYTPPPIYPTKRYTPLVRNDMETLRTIKNFLNNDYPEQEKYVLASGFVLNSEILNNLDRPYATSAVKNLDRTLNVDVRDGFPTDFFSADLIITTVPNLTHLKKDAQRIVTYLADLVKDETSYIGVHYEKLDQEFVIDEGVKVVFYEKISDMTEDDRRRLAEFYDSAYPEHPELFKERISEYKE